MNYLLQFILTSIFSLLKCRDDHFPNGKYVVCRVLKSIPKQSVVDVSLRSSREEGDLDEDEAPREGDTVQGYVVRTNKKGCFVRLARHIEARVTLKELCDGFLPNPEASFPMGRLVVGKVKEVRDAPKKSKGSKDPVKIQVDLDMRESTLLDSEKKLSFDDVELQDKYKGTVTRVESYGVFVQLENSKLSGLVHMSECSDNFIKNLQAMYDPGDLVKILVIKKDNEARKLGFSMKASHFQDDEDSDDDSSMGDSSDDDDEINMDVDKDDMSEDLDSDDENFASKLAAKMQKGKDNDENSSSGSEDDDEDQNSADDSDDESGSDSDSDSESDNKAKRQSPLDTDVGFEWGTGGQQAKTVSDDEDSSDDSDTDGDDEEEDNEGKSSSHNSRKKHAQRRQEEREISRRETALADGTADENPETAGDFERLLAGDPNSSELWIRYMAFHLSLADISSARAVADKALSRIDFSQEREKLNVWTALLTLEHKYGNEKTLQGTIDRACGQNNPKQVYLRACEILEKDLSSEEAITTANNMFTKMCKKFRSKKKVWLAHLQYLLKQSRHQEAHALLKRALLSLAPYKHAETMSKFAQLEFEFGSAERARTVFDGLVLKYPKRLDLFFVYLDKEVKHGSVKAARALLEQKVGERKLSDKQMKSLFKKWYRMEEQHGDEDTMEHVKDSARNFVEQSSK